MQSLVLLQFEYIRGSVFYQDLFKGYRYKSSKVYKGIWIHSFIFSLIHPANHQKWREKKGCGVSNDFYQIQNIKIIKIKKCVGVFIFSRSNCSPSTCPGGEKPRKIFSFYSILCFAMKRYEKVKKVRFFWNVIF